MDMTLLMTEKEFTNLHMVLSVRITGRVPVENLKIIVKLQETQTRHLHHLRERRSALRFRCLAS